MWEALVGFGIWLVSFGAAASAIILSFFQIVVYLTIIAGAIAVCAGIWLLYGFLSQNPSIFGHTKKQSSEPRFSVVNLNESSRQLKYDITHAVEGKDSVKLKEIEEEDKKEEAEKTREKKKKLYYLEFDGDVMATQNESFASLVSAVTFVAKTEDEVLIKVKSGGGTVTGYGLAASQVKRLRSKGIKTTALIDEVAASGGYMLACTADKVVAAPFAVIGSIGVVMEFHNFNKILKGLGVEHEEITAGEFKRTISQYGEITDEKRKKAFEDLQRTHSLFKKLVSDHRPNVDIEKVSTGETWYGQECIDLGLVDEISTSQDYIISKFPEYEVIHMSIRKPAPRQIRITDMISKGLSKVLSKISFS